MKIATFNINGIKARTETLCRWLDETNPDVAILQEIKSVDENFPRDLFEERGYNVETHGQKSFNGVAILSKYPLEDVVRGLPGDDSDEQTRWIEATVVGKTAIRMCGLYLPNGNPAPGPKFDYKLDTELMGGLKLQLGSFMIDTSIKNKLKKYEQAMLEN